MERVSGYRSIKKEPVECRLRDASAKVDRYLYITLKQNRDARASQLSCDFNASFKSYCFQRSLERALCKKNCCLCLHFCEQDIPFSLEKRSYRFECVAMGDHFLYWWVLVQRRVILDVLHYSEKRAPLPNLSVRNFDHYGQLHVFEKRTMCHLRHKGVSWSPMFAF